MHMFCSSSMLIWCCSLRACMMPQVKEVREPASPVPAVGGAAPTPQTRLKTRRSFEAAKLQVWQYASQQSCSQLHTRTLLHVLSIVSFESASYMQAGWVSASI